MNSFFINPSEYNYQLDTLSVVQDVANPVFTSDVPKDILGVNRFDDDGPDIGLYERLDEK